MMQAMSEPSENGSPPASPAALAAETADEVSSFDRLLAAVCILIGAGVIILGLDSLTGGRILGFATQQEE